MTPNYNSDLAVDPSSSVSIGDPISSIPVTSLPETLFSFQREEISYVQWVDSKEFLDWWMSTSFFVKQAGTNEATWNTRLGCSPKAFRDNPRRKAAEWKEFDQVARECDDHPFLRCHHCGAILAHPAGGSGRKNIGTRAVKIHLNANSCNYVQSKQVAGSHAVRSLLNLFSGLIVHFGLCAKQPVIIYST